MALIKQFDLAGVGSSVQFGKGGTQINSASGAFNMQNAAQSALVNVRVLDPVIASDAATKNYVDNAIQGLSVKQSVAAATTVVGGNITLSGLQTIDGYSVQAGDRILVKNQTNPTENGIYVAATGAWTRATDANTGAELAGAFVFVEDQTGATQSNTGWTVATVPPITIGSTNITWAQFSGAGSYTAGAGLSLSGGVFSANVDNVTTAIIGNDIVVAGGTAGKTLVSTGATEATWGAISLTNGSNAITGTLSVANGGTGASSLTAHGVLVGEGTSAVAALAVGTTGQVLLGVTGLDPAFGNINLASSAAVGSTILGLANGGTGADLTATAGGIVYGNTTDLQVSAAGTSGQILQSNGTSAPSFVDVSTVAVTGAANIGAGPGQVYSSLSSGTLDFNTISSVDSQITVNTDNVAHEVTLQLNDGNILINNLSGTLAVTKGGTGLSTVTAGNILYTTALNTFSAAPITSFGLSLLNDANSTAAQTTLGLTIGLNVEAWSARLDGLAALNSTGLMVQTGSATYTDVTIAASTAAGMQGINLVNGSGVSGAPTVGLDIAGLTQTTPTLDNAMLLPAFDGTNNVKISLQDIAAKVKLDNPVDPLFMYNNGITATTVMTAALPTNARVGRICVEVTTPFVGDGILVESLNGFLSTDRVSTYVDMTTAGIYIIDLAASATSDGAVTVTITGTGGSCNVNLNYNIIA